MRFLLPGIALILLAIACGGGSDARPADTTSARSPSAAADTAPPGQVTAPPVRVTITPSPGPPSADAPLYIALGDSLSYGVGASDRFTTAFVSLVHDSLPAGTGLLNLGHSGDTSGELIQHGYLDEAATEVARRNNDTNPNNDVTLVTLEIGGNDLLDLFFNYVVPGKCPTLDESLQRPECVDILRRTLDEFQPNLKQIVDRLQAADPHLNIVMLTLYNPFSGAIPAFDPFGDLSLEGMPNTPFLEGENDIIRAEAAASGVKLADVYPLFFGKAKEYVGMDIIHPNDTGYKVMADAVIAADKE
ncbi:MAG TPA: GDSL-type esterase/lipase family protein [Dehalococcoidia bacterium]|nr:GDSL-type esterase/lipase family protein [Dehalococcoidia bacterium]